MKCGHICLKILMLFALAGFAGNAMAQSIDFYSIYHEINRGANGIINAGDTIQFEFYIVNNDGFYDLYNVHVDPDNAGVVMPPDWPFLAAGGEVLIYGSYVITPTDMSNGVVVLPQPTVWACLSDNECSNVSDVYDIPNYTVYLDNPEVDFEVEKEFSDHVGLDVLINLTCMGATIQDPTDQSASEASPAVFHLTNMEIGSTCTATESSIPPDYVQVPPYECENVNVYIPYNYDGAEAPNEVFYDPFICKIYNEYVPSETFTVHKDFEPDNPGLTVQITLESCAGATFDDPGPISIEEGQAAEFTIHATSGWIGPRYCTAKEQPLPDYIPYQQDCEDVPVFDGGQEPPSCTMVNTYIPPDVDFTVNKVFSPENTVDEVTVKLSCTAADVDNLTLTASMGSPAVFKLSNVLSGNTCTATEEEVPAGYLPNESDCNMVAVGPESTGESCTIFNDRIEGYTSFTVRKVFSPSSTATVEISLSCTNATIEDSTLPASMSSPAVFNLTEVGSGNTCTATEQNVPAGYVQDDSDCEAVSAELESTSSCEIINTKIPGDTTFTVSKVFEPAMTDPVQVQISLTCTKANIDESPKSASAASPAVFELSNVEAGNTCTAEESGSPTGYISDADMSCVNITANPETASGCTITNTMQSPVKFIVYKDFWEESNDTPVQISLDCGTSATVEKSPLPASESSPAEFNLTNVGDSANCTATESSVPGYSYDPEKSNCSAVPVNSESTQESCTIVNIKDEPTGTAVFTVNKVFTDFTDGDSLVVQITLDCTKANFDGSSTKPASQGSPAIFNLINVDTGNECTATETDIPDGYELAGNECIKISTPPGSSDQPPCTITNSPKPQPKTTFTVSIDYPGEAQDVTLTCTDASPDKDMKKSSSGNPAVFDLSDVAENNACSASVTPPLRWAAQGCQNVKAPEGEESSCSITYTEVYPEPPGGDPVHPKPPVYVLDHCLPSQGNAPEYQGVCQAWKDALLADDTQSKQAAANAAEQYSPKGTEAPGETANQTAMMQISAIDGRIGTLRGGGGAGFSASGFSIAVGDATVSGSLLKSFLSNFNQNNPAFMQNYANQYQASVNQNMAYGNQNPPYGNQNPPYGNQNLPYGNQGRANAGQSNDSGFIDEFGRWGVWISGRIVWGDKDATSLQYGYDFDTAGLTFGVDYRFTDKFVAGVAVGYADTSADIGSNNASLDTKGYSVSLYGTWFQSDRFYMAGSIGYGGNDYDQTRNVVYSLPGTNPFNNVNQSFMANYDGSQFSAALSGGWEFNKNGWTFGPTFSINYVDVNVDGFSEELGPNSGGTAGAGGWAASIDDQTYQSLQPAIGFEVSKAVSLTWGVMIPQAYIDVVSEVKDGSRVITGTFLGVADQTDKFGLPTDDFEETFARAGLGVGFIFKNNKSAFCMIDADLGRDLLSTYYVNAGFRWQF